MPRTFAPVALVVLSVVLGCGSSSSGTGIPREGGARGSGGSSSGSVNCDSVCPAVVAAHCSGGPVSQADCVSGCQTINAGKCEPKYEALYACAGASPTYACDSGGRVTVTGCESVATDLYTCLAGG